jgi:hemoglobin-like flavoprotein
MFGLKVIKAAIAILLPTAQKIKHFYTKMFENEFIRL